MIAACSPSARLSRRALLASGISIFAAACGRKKASGFNGYAAVAIAGEQAVSIVDLTRFRHLKNVDLKAEPKILLPGPAGEVFAVTPANGSVHRLSSEFTLKSSHRLTVALAGASLSSDGTHILAISADPAELLVAHVDTLQVGSRYRLRATPVHLTSGAGGYAAVSGGGTGSIELFHLPTGQRWHRQLNCEMGKLIFRADGQLLLAANLQERSLTVLSVPSLEIVAELPLAMRPENLCFGVDGGQLFISGDGMDGIAIVFPYRVLQVDQTVLAGRDPGVMAVSGSPAYLFVGSASGSDICVMAIQNRRVIGLVDVTQQPGFITLTPDDQYALVLNEASGDMAVIHVSAIRQDFHATSNRTGASLFTMVPVGDRPVHAIIVPANA